MGRKFCTPSSRVVAAERYNHLHLPILDSSAIGNAKTLAASQTRVPATLQR